MNFITLQLRNQIKIHGTMSNQGYEFELNKLLPVEK